MIRLLCLCISMLFCSFVGQLHAQDMPRTVVGSAGTFHDNLLFGDLHFTVGEIAVSRYKTDDGQLDEGFHRGYFDLIVSAEDFFPVDWKVSLYPNPTADYLQLQLPAEVTAQVELFSTLGQLLEQTSQVVGSHQIDLSNFPAGTYLLRLLDEEGHSASFQVQKISR